MMFLCVVNEFSFFHVLILATQRKSILILEVEPFFPLMKGPLTRLITLLVSFRLMGWAIDKVPELRRVKEVPRRALLYDVFGKTEKWQNNYFSFLNAEDNLGQYGLAYKKAVTNYMSNKHVGILTSSVLMTKFQEKKLQGVGIPKDTLGSLAVFCKNSLDCINSFSPYRGVNSILFIGSVVFCVLKLAFLSKLFKPVSREIFLAADFIADLRDIRLYRELEEGGKLLMVMRTGSKKIIPKEAVGFTFCDRKDGALFLGDLLKNIIMVLGDLWKLGRFCSHVHPALFRRLMALVYQRLLYRAFFYKFRPRYYWGRDPYSEDHIIRRQELNLIGGLSFGVSSGHLTWAILIPQYRYLSFDKYYVLGRGKYKQYYGHTWANNMTVVPAGSFSGMRSHYTNRFRKRTLDIAVFSSVFVGELKFAEFINGLAKAFPERRVILQMKALFSDIPATEEFIEMSRKDAPNVETSTAPALDILESVGYAFSDPSSVVLEALQFGARSFAFDMPDLQRENINRQYPSLIVRTSSDAIDRIKNIESGDWKYPLDEFEEIVDLSGTVFFDRIRMDMMLSAKQPAISLLTDQ